MDDKLLSIYLNDHLAGAAAGLELARRTLSNNEGTSYESFLRDLVQAIEEDKTELESLMDTLGISHDRLKQGAAWVAEKAGRLKLNGQLTGYSPLSRLVRAGRPLLGGRRQDIPLAVTSEGGRPRSPPRGHRLREVDSESRRTAGRTRRAPLACRSGSAYLVFRAFQTSSVGHRSAHSFVTNG